MAKHIPWIKQLRRLAKKYQHCKKELDHAGLIPEYTAFYACFKRLVSAVDFTGVTWSMTYYNTGSYGACFRMEASFKKNPTPWMKVLKETRKFPVRWKYGSRFHDEFHHVRINIDDTGIGLEFTNRDKAVVYCRKHKIKEINLRKLESSYDEMIKKVELDRKLSREFVDKLFGKKGKRGKRN